MSKRIAVALAVTLGLGKLATAAQARPEMVGVHGAEFSPGTIVVRTGERHLYLILDQDHAMRYPVGGDQAGLRYLPSIRVVPAHCLPARPTPTGDRKSVV